MTAIDRLLTWDRSISSRLVALVNRARWLQMLALIVTHSGDSILWLLGAGVAIYWGGDLCKPLGWRILVGMVVCGLSTGFLKALFRRQRPAGGQRTYYIGPDRHSFPSGHATRAACMVVFLSPLIPFWATGALMVWALLLGLSRVALSFHLASDVVGGWVSGAAVGALLLWVL